MELCPVSLGSSAPVCSNISAVFVREDNMRQRQDDGGGRMKLLQQAAALGIVLIAAFAGATPPASAQSAEDFYRGKQITLVIGLGAGETYDLYARLLARH